MYYKKINHEILVVTVYHMHYSFINLYSFNKNSTMSTDETLTNCLELIKSSNLDSNNVIAQYNVRAKHLEMISCNSLQLLQIETWIKSAL